MKLTVMQPTEINVDYCDISVAVRYEEEDIPNDFPGRTGDMWKVRVCVDNGEIQGWVNDGVDRSFTMKVCDQGTYTLLNHVGEEMFRREDDYVPGWVPGRYGDYIDLKITGNKITNWKPRPEDVRSWIERDND